MTDEVGILSVYVTLDPSSPVESGSTPPWELRIRHQLEELTDRLKQDGPREHWRALTTRLEQLRPQLDELLDRSATGQGRALFAPLSGGEVRTVSLQVPLGDKVTLEPQPYLRPLVGAWTTAGPAGLVPISAEEVRVVDLRLGVTEGLATFDYQGTVEQRELKGPAADNPALAQHGAPQHDLYERREEDKLLRFLRTVGPKLAGYAKEREWGFLVLTGEPHLVQAVREGLPPQFPAEVVALDNPVNSLPEPKLLAAVGPALEEARQRRHRALAERARGNAMSANAGTCGLGDTLGALNQGRVAHLLLDGERQWTGSRTPEGLLVPEGEVPPGVDEASLTREPNLGERMLELAFQSSAEVTVLAPQAAEPLADFDGIGAILRW